MRTHLLGVLVAVMAGTIVVQWFDRRELQRDVDYAEARFRAADALIVESDPAVQAYRQALMYCKAAGLRWTWFAVQAVDGKMEKVRGFCPVDAAAVPRIEGNT